MKIAGTPVVDARKPVVIKISARDVANGDTKDPAACAAALACKRELHATDARVHIGRTYVKLDNKWVRYQTSKPLRSEIIAFDRGGKFEPGEYVLSPLTPKKLPDGKRQGGASKSKKPDKPARKRRKYHVVAGIRQHGANR